MSDFRVWVQKEIGKPVSWALPAQIMTPVEYSEYLDRLQTVERELGSNLNVPYEYTEDDASVFRRALLHRRRAYAEENETLGLKTSNPRILEQLKDRLAPVDRLMGATFFSNGQPYRLLRLTDFLTLQEIYALLGETLATPRPEYDEKFGLLLAPTQFFPRLALARREAWLRGTCLGVAFVDIDDFKAFNVKHGEYEVDRSVLPVFMRALEAHVHSHGCAFRFGGDEYVVLLPNTRRDTAIPFLGEFQRTLRTMTFAGHAGRLSVSIGLCTATPESALTDRELLERATGAKHAAKRGGKDRIEWVDGDALPAHESVVTSHGSPAQAPA